MIICLEGIDASGKATQSRLLAERIGAKLHSFPNYDSPSGKLIQSYLQGGWSIKADPIEPWLKGVGEDVFQALQVVNKLESAQQLEDDAFDGFVVLDRYWPSALVYGPQTSAALSLALTVAAKLPSPDYYILIDVDVEESFKRRPERRDAYERNAPFLYQVRERYRMLWNKPPLNDGSEWVMVNGALPVEEVHAIILGCLGYKK